MANTIMMPNDAILNAPSRLSILAFLSTANSVEYTNLLEAVDMTSGNLSTHLTKLETNGFVSVTKKFVNKRPKTTISMTTNGRKRFLKYISDMEAYYANLAKSTGEPSGISK